MGLPQVHLEKNGGIWIEDAESELGEGVKLAKTATNGGILFLHYAPLNAKVSDDTRRLVVQGMLKEILQFLLHAE